ncbi:MAG: hypothetical protein HY323_17000 [Betaproteobacteria bacterium]|nr:hypothetical protein [Betaproteobacteria bacterium]
MTWDDTVNKFTRLIEPLADAGRAGKVIQAARKLEETDGAELVSAINDFAPVVLMTRLQLILVANPAFPENTVKEVIALARTRPGQITFASTGTGGGAHLAGELLKKTAGIDMTHVPYKGSAPAYTDLMSGQVQLLFNNIISTMPLGNSPGEFGQMMRFEMKKWGDLIRSAGIRVETAP